MRRSVGKTWASESPWATFCRHGNQPTRGNNVPEQAPCECGASMHIASPHAEPRPDPFIPLRSVHRRSYPTVWLLIVTRAHRGNVAALGGDYQRGHNPMAHSGSHCSVSLVPPACPCNTPGRDINSKNSNETQWLVSGAPAANIVRTEQGRITPRVRPLRDASLSIGPYAHPF